MRVYPAVVSNDINDAEDTDAEDDEEDKAEEEERVAQTSVDQELEPGGRRVGTRELGGGRWEVREARGRRSEREMGCGR